MGYYVMLFQDDHGPVEDSAYVNAVGELFGLGPSKGSGPTEAMGVWPITDEQDRVIRERLRDPDAADARDREAAQPFASEEDRAEYVAGDANARP